MPRSSGSRIRRRGSGSNSRPIGRLICVRRWPRQRAIPGCLLGLSCWSTLASVRNTVLVCDDAALMRSLLSDILDRGGFEVVGEACSGSEAVDKFRVFKPELV